MNRPKNSEIDNSPSIYMINPLKMNRTKKKVLQKIETVFDFIREIPLKWIGPKKKFTEKLKSLPILSKKSL